jgi:hypothetical protein
VDDRTLGEGDPSVSDENAFVWKRPTLSLPDNHAFVLKTLDLPLPDNHAFVLKTLDFLPRSPGEVGRRPGGGVSEHDPTFAGGGRPKAGRGASLSLQVENFLLSHVLGEMIQNN